MIDTAFNQAEGGPAIVPDQLSYRPFPKPDLLSLRIVHPRYGVDE
jgi:hypothetical protein